MWKTRSYADRRFDLAGSLAYTKRGQPGKGRRASPGKPTPTLSLSVGKVLNPGEDFP